MSRRSGIPGGATRLVVSIITARNLAGWARVAMVGLAALVSPAPGHAESRTGSAGSRAHLDFRIIIPAIVRATVIAQPDYILIEDRHISIGYIDLDGGTSIQLTTNSRAGYVIAATYDTQLLSRIDVRVSSQNLAASSGTGTMRVASGLATNKLVPISYRLYLAPGAQKGSYRWPVTLSFSPIAV